MKILASLSFHMLPLGTRSHKLGIEVASWDQNASNTKICNKGLVEDDYDVLCTGLAYSKIRESSNDIL